MPQQAQCIYATEPGVLGGWLQRVAEDDATRCASGCDTLQLSLRHVAFTFAT